MKPRDIIIKAIMRYAGLSDFDRDIVEEEADCIIKALNKAGYSIIEKSYGPSRTKE